MSYKEHALAEFRAAGWVDADGKFNDDMQKMICDHVMLLLEVFSQEGHSGSSAPYAINLFKQLASFEPIVPLTGEDWEWVDVTRYGSNGTPLFQNKRCSRVFKDAEGAYDIEGIVFYDWYTDEETGEKFKSYFTSKNSRVKIEFPYTPTKEYVLNTEV